MHLKWVRMYITHDTFLLVANTLVSSTSIECIHNSAARIEKTSRCTSVAPVLNSLHWLSLFTVKTVTLDNKIVHWFLRHVFLLAVLITPGAVRVLVISLLYKSIIRLLNIVT